MSFLFLAIREKLFIDFKFVIYLINKLPVIDRNVCEACFIINYIPFILTILSTWNKIDFFLSN